ncbi:STAS domain-containing protein [uncultured Desulfobacter sp.]|uniref:STAS domain-containing protein n=1 Tax=uncultured Desulfobacter sp. TaxID=240139 RepID=UPI002AA6BA5C|nr:STAS domain-containing protein [uncultured Desulfobacter sp.]
MVSKNYEKDGNLVMRIEGALSAYEVKDLKDSLLTGFANYNGIIVDINGVTECDTLGLQLLLSAGKTAEKLNKTFNITGNSQSILDAIIALGLEAENFHRISEEA